MNKTVEYNELIDKTTKAKEASRELIRLTTEQKNSALLVMADALETHTQTILDGNTLDLERGRQQNMSASLLDRLTLNNHRITAMAEALRDIAAFDDPIGQNLQTIERENGLHIEKIRVPIGVIGIVYEARPNVTVDAAGLCLKTGNAVVLRGGTAAVSSNEAIVHVLHQAMDQAGVPSHALQYISDPDRKSVDEMLRLNGLIDVIIPRGGRGLIQHVVRTATVPVIETGEGICHTYIDEGADYKMAEAIAINAKVQRPSVCNAMETLLVHRQFAEQHLRELNQSLRHQKLELRGCSKSIDLDSILGVASEEDWSTEYLDYILAIKIVENLDEALSHIQQYGTMHSEAIITENRDHAARFLQEVDAAAVYHNASTRFTDGAEFGYGAEIGISTQKLHTRGPMGLQDLTSTKYLIYGKGQTRG